MSDLSNAPVQTFAYFLNGPETVKEPTKPFYQRKKVRKFSLGVIEKTAANLVFVILTVVFGSIATLWLTQPAVVAAPSVYVDAVTGCQYLTMSSGITPRLSAAGTQLCGEVK